MTRLAVISLALLSACTRDKAAPVEPSPSAVTDAPPIAEAASVSARSRTLNGCRYTYFGDLQVTAPADGGTVVLSVSGPATGCRYRVTVPANSWLRASSAWRTGTSAMQVTASANTETVSRSVGIRIEAETPGGIVTFQSIRVTQNVSSRTPPPVCTYSTAESVVEFPPAGGRQVFAIAMSDARCPTPVLRDGFAVPTAPGQYPGRFVTEVSVQNGQPVLTVTAPANGTSSVRAESFVFNRTADRTVDSSTVLVLVQRGAQASPPPRVSALTNLSGENQIFSLPVTAPGGTCWYWSAASQIGSAQPWITGLSPKSNAQNRWCGDNSIVAEAAFNRSGRVRTGVAWLVDGGYNSIRDFGVIRQAPIP